MKQTSKITTLKKKKEFNHVFKKGKSYVTRNLVVYIVENNLNYNRLGFIISKKVGNSVTRNRIRRLLKESYRKNRDKIDQGFDLIFIVRHRAAGITYKQVKKELFKLLNKAGIEKNQE